MLTRDSVLARAREVGFDLAGIARAERHPKLARLTEWIAAGRHGEMQYLADSAWERIDPSEVLPTARSVVSLAVVYNSSEPAAGAISRYAWGDDYHDIVRERLTSLVRWMADTAGPGFEAFSCVDNGPVMEKVFAEQAGLGWIGKHTCVINPALGSWLFLAEVLINVELEPDAPGVDQCGTCTRCIDACPTAAIVGPYELDATRCISYLTIETRAGLPEKWRRSLADKVAGCDICQDVCPWNRRAAVSANPAWRPHERLRGAGIIDLCRLDDDAWRGIIRTSAMRRAGLRRIRRSLAYAAASLPPVVRRDALEALASWPSSEFPEVADAIDWARAQTEA
ncbi:MAG TPA: tRNA epoxyqueuosine(34) reductase QueG [Vicinamibacterales bacterium]|nr:tRNA epoxyqueuosine(34) reductase QueG [Vicinamibacterales bacterium]